MSPRTQSLHYFSKTTPFARQMGFEPQLIQLAISSGYTGNNAIQFCLDVRDNGGIGIRDI